MISFYFPFIFFVILFVGTFVIFNRFGNVIFGTLVPLTTITMITVLFGPGLKNIFQRKYILEKNY